MINTTAKGGGGNKLCLTERIQLKRKTAYKLNDFFHGILTIKSQGGGDGLCLSKRNSSQFFEIAGRVQQRLASEKKREFLGS